MLLIQKAWYTRADLRANPDRLYAWGDNMARFGGANNPKSGQAFACRGEPNAVGIPTKRLPTMKDDAFFTDADFFGRVRDEMDAAFDSLTLHLAAGKDVVWPADGIGTGRALLQQKAPKLWAHLQSRLERLKAYGIRHI